MQRVSSIAVLALHCRTRSQRRRHRRHHPRSVDVLDDGAVQGAGLPRGGSQRWRA